MPVVSGGVWRMSFEIHWEGTKKFGDLTSRLVGRQIGIFLDGEPTGAAKTGPAVADGWLSRHHRARTYYCRQRRDNRQLH